MNVQKSNNSNLDDFKVNVKIKLAALWTCFMFFYIYVDYFHLYMPNTMKDIQNGIVFKFEITQGFLLFSMIAVSIPAIMIFLSAFLPARVNRWTNIGLAILYIPFTLFNLVGEAWVHMIYAALVEVLLLGLIIYYAWKWPRSSN